MSKSFDPRRGRAARERAVLVSVALPGRPFAGGDELRGLAATAGTEVVGELTQKRQDIHPATYIGSGKVAELREAVERAAADVVAFDNDLSPAQARNLAEAVGVKVIDRTELVLDIFATRAQTAEARLQVELAQLEYALPRLKNLWTHLSRQAGGGVGLRGPGETQLETDRRLAAGRIRDLKRRIAGVQARKGREVAGRAGERTVSLVGYTNAGKSRLMNALTGAGVAVEDRLFSTLDTRTRRWQTAGSAAVLLSDTVGFIRDLPHHLVASFKATLEEAHRADVLIHVVDASSPHAAEHIRAVNAVLEELGCGEKPTVLVLNKADQVADRSQLQALAAKHPAALVVSALNGEGLGALTDTVLGVLSPDFADTEVRTGSGDGGALAFLNAHADVYRQEYQNDGNEVVIRCYLPRHLMGRLCGFAVKVRALAGETGLCEPTHATDAHSTRQNCR
jgi:GTP-binding protein HflX